MAAAAGATAVALCVGEEGDGRGREEGIGGGSSPFGSSPLARALQRRFDEEAAEKARRASFSCPLCLETRAFENSVELDCFHRVCCGCFLAYLQVKIREKHVTPEELCCPMPKCGCEITVAQVEGATHGTPLWERFLTSRMQLWRPEGEQELLVECPMGGTAGGGCGASFLVQAGAGEAQCPACRARFCPRCRVLHEGETCEAYQVRRRQDAAGPPKEEVEFEELLRQRCWQRCPHCTAPCDRHLGCNFMTCHSEQCRGKKHFCYVCGDSLAREDHIVHFPEGIYENCCVRMDRRQEPAMPKARIFEDAAQPRSLFGDLVELFDRVRGRN